MKNFNFRSMIPSKKIQVSVKAPFFSYQKITWLHWTRFTGEACLLCLVINRLFYQKALAFLFLCPLGAYYVYQRKKQELKCRKQALASVPGCSVCASGKHFRRLFTGKRH